MSDQVIKIGRRRVSIRYIATYIATGDTIEYILASGQLMVQRFPSPKERNEVMQRLDHLFEVCITMGEPYDAEA